MRPLCRHRPPHTAATPRTGPFPRRWPCDAPRSPRPVHMNSDLARSPPPPSPEARSVAVFAAGRHHRTVTAELTCIKSPRRLRRRRRAIEPDGFRSTVGALPSRPPHKARPLTSSDRLCDVRGRAQSPGEREPGSRGAQRRPSPVGGISAVWKWSGHCS